MKAIFGRLFREEDGQDLIEYALLASLIALACVSGMTLLAGGINTLFTNVKSQLVP